MKGKIHRLETDSKNKNIKKFYRGIIEFRNGYQPGSDVLKDAKGDRLADSHSILNSWRNISCQLLNVHGVNDVRQTEIHTAEPLVPEPSAFDVKMAVEKLKIYKSASIDQISVELIKAEGRTIRFEILQLINPLNPELNPICYLLALLGAHHFLHVSRIRVKLLTFRLLMSYMWSTHS